MDSSSWSFDLQYLLSRPPWDTEVTPPEVVELIEGEDLAPGRALDLGCGTGTNYMTIKAVSRISLNTRAQGKKKTTSMSNNRNRNATR